MQYISDNEIACLPNYLQPFHAHRGRRHAVYATFKWIYHSTGVKYFIVEYIKHILDKSFIVKSILV